MIFKWQYTDFWIFVYYQAVVKIADENGAESGIYEYI